MTNCTSLFAHASSAEFFATHVIALPIIFVVGVVGSLLTIIVLNHSQLRTTNALYVYLTALASFDLLSLVLAIPASLRDTAAVPPAVGFSHQMASFSTFQYGLSSIFKHAAAWMVVMVVLVRYMALVTRRKRRRFTTISTSRIIAFAIALACLVVDFPRFFELRVEELHGHCLGKNVHLWLWAETVLASDPSLRTVYPWVVAIIFVGLPFLLILLLGIMLCMRIRLWQIVHRYSAVTSAPDGNEMEVNVLVLVISAVYLCLEIPEAVTQIFIIDARQKLLPETRFNALVLVSQCFSLLHSSMNFFLYTAISSDFRKAFRRIFCCSCLTGDEYYEPVTCADVATCACCCPLPQPPPKEMTLSRSSSEGSSTRAHSDPEEAYTTPPVKYTGPNVARGGWI